MGEGLGEVGKKRGRDEEAQHGSYETVTAAKDSIRNTVKNIVMTMYGYEIYWGDHLVRYTDV